MNVAGQMVLAVAEEVSIKGSYGSVIFVACFFLAAIIAGIWWLRR